MHHRSHDEGGLHPGRAASRGDLPAGGLGRPPSTTGYGQQAGGTHPTGMHSSSNLHLNSFCQVATFKS